MQPNEQKVLTAEQVAAKVKRADDAIEATQYDVWYPGYGDGSFHCSNPSPSCDRKLRAKGSKWRDIDHNDHTPECKIGKVAKSLDDVAIICTSHEVLRAENADLRQRLKAAEAEAKRLRGELQFACTRLLHWYQGGKCSHDCPACRVRLFLAAPPATEQAESV